MVNKPVLRPYFWGGGTLEGVGWPAINKQMSRCDDWSSWSCSPDFLQKRSKTDPIYLAKLLSFQNLNKSGQMIIFHQPRFPWNKGSRISLQNATFWGKSVVWGRELIWPDEWFPYFSPPFFRWPTGTETVANPMINLGFLQVLGDWSILYFLEKTTCTPLKIHGFGTYKSPNFSEENHLKTKPAWLWGSMWIFQGVSHFE